MIWRMWVLTSLGALFEEIYFFFCVILDLSHNLTEMHIVKKLNVSLQTNRIFMEQFWLLGTALVHDDKKMLCMVINRVFPILY